VPVGDVIFTRLRSATQKELEACAACLEVQLTSDRETNVVKLSEELRSAGGNSFANLFRDPHELAYREILVDVSRAAAEQAGWKPVSPPDTSKEEWIEEYIFRAVAFAKDPAVASMSVDEKARARVAAEDVLKVGVAAGVDPNVALPLGALAAGAGAVVLGATALPFAIAYAALKYSSPAIKKTLPATMVLIQIRKRIELEDQLKSESAQ
jgi:hypothetical protein